MPLDMNFKKNLLMHNTYTIALCVQEYYSVMIAYSQGINNSVDKPKDGAFW